ncbi:glycosyltransferase family 4 protein [Planococcus sp. ISL-109]|uniref:glycosyltransferase family 4 protein n=1 Tax=Planococcus sp. ISL-109 TaxID=2819166 RepID=UPI001BE68EC8|nr:glycosyltransferase family 4 protein [Planococcus sp. ISL-109]MBT2581543.1 glycosyltransferase family 4 protein [Planococcus sp. ISL-109]
MTAKILHAMTIAQSLKLVRGQLNDMQTRGFEVKALTSNGQYARIFEEEEGVKVLHVEMEREIALKKDLESLFACIRLIRKEKPDIVNAGTPKAGLIVSLAAYYCRVPVRIYNVLGLRLETTTGVKRQILLMAEKIAAASSTHLLAVSPSLKQQIVELGIAPAEKIRILGHGSVNGFDLKRFELDKAMKARVDEKRAAYGWTDEHIVLGSMGRITKDKGIDETVRAFLELAGRYPNLRLLLVGDYESADAVSKKTLETITEHPHIVHEDHQLDPVPFYHLMDLFLFLTKREGFGNVSAEAALTGIPVVAANVTGARDTLVDGETGYLVDPDDHAGVLAKLEMLIQNLELRERLGSAGQEWVRQYFSNEALWEEMDSYYQTCLMERSGVLEEA